jgi:hypothetical protein
MSNWEVLHSAIECFADPARRPSYFDLYAENIILHGYAGVDPGLESVKRVLRSILVCISGCESDRRRHGGTRRQDCITLSNDGHPPGSDPQHPSDRKSHILRRDDDPPIPFRQMCRALECDRFDFPTSSTGCQPHSQLTLCVPAFGQKAQSSSDEVIAALYHHESDAYQLVPEGIIPARPVRAPNERRSAMQRFP